ncbi:hypothetical protein CAEBREN_07024 [Caenorhabditis brenneri]|uniref:Uncharacterized protein n=1 Tax=Caenorhabditis brenneri TaxID=135651 RepID=G0P2T1_CAEBE|nr:hypothetical protein CAEBREN_07024 [Caenorhabditis brenneri]
MSHLRKFFLLSELNTKKDEYKKLLDSKDKEIDDSTMERERIDAIFVMSSKQQKELANKVEEQRARVHEEQVGAERSTYDQLKKLHHDKQFSKLERREKETYGKGSQEKEGLMLRRNGKNFDLKVANIVCTKDLPRAGRLLSESDRNLLVERQRTKELKAENQRLKEGYNEKMKLFEEKEREVTKLMKKHEKQAVAEKTKIADLQNSVKLYNTRSSSKAVSRSEKEKSAKIVKELMEERRKAKKRRISEGIGERDLSEAERLLKESDRKLLLERQRTKELKAENQRMKEALNDHATQIQISSNRSAVETKNSATLRKELDQAKQRANQLNGRLAILQKELLDSRDKEIDVLKKERERIDAVNGKLLAELTDDVEQERLIGAVEKENTLLKSTNEKLMEDLATEREDNTQMKTALAVARSKICEMEKAALERTEQLEDVKNKLNCSKANEAKMEGTVEVLSAEKNEANERGK